jgi:WD40 repeat protein
VTRWDGAWCLQLVAHTLSSYCIDIDASGRYAATGGADGMVSIIDTEDFVSVRAIDRLEYVTSPVIHVVCSIVDGCVPRQAVYSIREFLPRQQVPCDRPGGHVS